MVPEVVDVDEEIERMEKEELEQRCRLFHRRERLYGLNGRTMTVASVLIFYKHVLGLQLLDSVIRFNCAGKVGGK